MEKFLSLIEPLNNCDWDDVDIVSQHALQALGYLNDNREVLTDLVVRAANDPTLLAMCEFDAVLYKLVIYATPAVRLRIHIFKKGCADRAHNHRWTFSAHVLNGGYTHTIYDSNMELSTSMKYTDLRPVLVRNETVGSAYTLHHGHIHTLLAEPDTISVMLRGPAMKEKMLILDKDLNESWWQFGEANDKTEEDKKNTKLSYDEYQSITGYLREKEIIL
jgi:hypothetical protein